MARMSNGAKVYKAQHDNRAKYEDPDRHAAREADRAFDDAVCRFYLARSGREHMPRRMRQSEWESWCRAYLAAQSPSNWPRIGDVSFARRRRRRA